MKKGTDFAAEFREALGRPLGEAVALKDHSSFKIGGPADFFFEAETRDDLRRAISLARSANIPFFVIGGGYNILFADEGYRGLIIRNRIQGISPVPAGDSFEVFSGTALPKIIQSVAENGLEGLEFLAGIPGTLGGALYMNAGAFGFAIGDLVTAVILLDGSGRERRVSRDALTFSYRRSILQKNHEIVLSAVLEGRPGDPRRIRRLIDDNLGNRRRKHPPWGTPCAGSYFRNPVLTDGSRTPAGALLEEAGARDVRVGGAAVYPGHCNFLINTGEATAKDVLELAGILKERVKVKFGIELEEEVIHLEESSSMP
jgi:UDP-N-acetylmuramate dehydrogenase